MGIEDDILPDTNVDRDRTTTGKFALGLLVVMIVFLTISFCSPHWLEARTLEEPLLTHQFSNRGRSKHANYIFL